ncbi:hypothetical protein KEM60_02110 [Austwickia sp. TVS 96-490-7B]|nr:hypothetical protein [Austwickia sp. TVS 96-490-7B]
MKKRLVLAVPCAVLTFMAAMQAAGALGFVSGTQQRDYQQQRARGWSKEEIAKQEALKSWTDVKTLHIVEEHEGDFTSK